MKKILLTLLAFVATVAMNAEQVSKQQALQKAQQFMPGKQFGEARGLARSAGSSEGEPFYVFNAEGNQGFVIVSGDDRTSEILGYSKTGKLDINQLPENLKGWLEGYARQIEALGTSAEQANKAKTRGADSWKAIAPLIQTQWDQHYPYNMMCPDWTGKDWRDPGFDTDHLMTDDQTKYHCVTGCVAAAMAQVIYYWKCLDNCQAIPAYKTDSRGWTMNALPATIFKWAQMKNTYKGDETGESAEAVAELFRYCGQAVEMDYGLGGSSAGVTPFELAEYFGFGKNAKYVVRSLYSQSVWEDMIYKELSENRPVLYGGSSLSGGHQFIVDGYDGSGLFHMNWGWGGMSDGYFVLSLANPDNLGAGGGTSADGYSVDQHAIIGLMPGTSGEEEILQFYGKFKGDLVNSVFSRASASEDFTDIVLPGYIFFQYENSDQTGECTFETAWGLYRDGSLLDVLGASEPVTREEGYIAYNNSPIAFGKDLVDGHYQFLQMYKLEGSTEWQLCESPHDNYGNLMIAFVDAVISDNKLTLRKVYENVYTTNYTVNEITYSSPELEVGRPVEVTVNLTNNGDSFQELLYLSCGSEKTVVCGSVEAGQTGNVKLHFTPTKAGTMTLKISTDKSAKNVVWSEAVTVVAAKKQSLSGTMVIDNFDKARMVLTGTTLKVTAQITNKGANDYDNAIELRLYKNTEDPASSFFGGPLVKSKSVMTTIPVGETKEVEFIIEDLNLDDNYFFFIYYLSAGKKSKMLTGNPFTLTGETEETDTPSVDVATIVQLIMAGQYDAKADLNGDNNVDAADLVLLVNKIK